MQLLYIIQEYMQRISKAIRNLIWQYCISGKQGSWLTQSGKEENRVGIVSWKNVQYNKSQSNLGFKTTDIKIVLGSEMG